MAVDDGAAVRAGDDRVRPLEQHGTSCRGRGAACGLDLVLRFGEQARKDSLELTFVRREHGRFAQQAKQRVRIVME